MADPCWRVKFDEAAWHVDLAGASVVAKRQALTWRRRLELAGGVPHSELLRCDPEHDRWPLPACVKTRIPDPSSANLRRSPWGAVLLVDADDRGLYLTFVAFGLRHPDAAASHKPSVYQLAATRL